MNWSVDSPRIGTDEMEQRKEERILREQRLENSKPSGNGPAEILDIQQRQSLGNSTARAFGIQQREK